MPAKVARNQLGRRKFEGLCAWTNGQLSIRTGGLSIPKKNFMCEKYSMTTFNQTQSHGQDISRCPADNSDIFLPAPQLNQQ
jgi:hypothetical protein